MSLKTAIITFHAAHNYGSMLQAYALQQIVIGLGCENVILNLRTERQKFMYRHPDDTKNAGWRSKYIGAFIKSFIKSSLIKKYDYFENFLRDDLYLTEEFKDLEEVAQYCAKKYFDYYIAGSDQIWNTACEDFDWSFFLPFAQNNAISYACSMGPHGFLQVKQENYNKMNECLKQFKGISVREQGTADVITKITGNVPEVTLDPTLLLTSSEWEKNEHFISEPLIKGEYIFLYTPAYKKEAYRIAKRLAQITNLQVVVSNFHHQSLFSCPSFTRKLDCGPWQFLNLIKNAKVVVSGSFHAVVFSIVFNTSFFAVNGDKDNRMNSILSKLGLGRQTINLTNVTEKAKLIANMDWKRAMIALSAEREKSISYLKKHLV